METIQLICTANQFTGFYMGATLAFNGLSELTSIRTIGFPIISVEIEKSINWLTNTSKIWRRSINTVTKTLG